MTSSSQPSISRQRRSQVSRATISVQKKTSRLMNIWSWSVSWKSCSKSIRLSSSSPDLTTWWKSQKHRTRNTKTITNSTRPIPNTTKLRWKPLSSSSMLPPSSLWSAQRRRIRVCIKAISSRVCNASRLCGRSRKKWTKSSQVSATHAQVHSQAS